VIHKLGSMAVDITQLPVDVKIDDRLYRENNYYAPRQDIPEKEKDSKWYFKNIQYILSFYNQPVGILNFPSGGAVNSNTTGTVGAGQRGASDMPIADRDYPVQFMVRMMQYYLGKQPNMNYAWLTNDVTTSNMQSQWIKGQEVSEFVNFFKGSIMARISNAYFTAKPMSQEAVSERENVFNSIMLKLDLKPVFDQLAEMGMNYQPANGQDFEMPEQVEKWMETGFKEFGAEMAGDIANGIWFTNNWVSKTLQAFMHVTITSLCAMEHYVENGRSMQRIRMPYQLIIDNRVDDDYGKYDEFIGVIDNLTPYEVFRKYPQFTAEQRDILVRMSQDAQLGSQYNITTNLVWWNYGQIGRGNTLSSVTAYWRTLRDSGYAKKEDKYGVPKIKKTAADGMTYDKAKGKRVFKEPEYIIEDICKGTLIGNRFLVDWGYIDNVVEDIQNKSRPLFPLIRFRPNTFLGESISEVARIHRIQDELDMYDFKIREMIGRAKGKTYAIRASKLGPNTPKTLLDDLTSIGFTLIEDSGEAGDESNNQRLVEELDFSLDPSIQALAGLYSERQTRMGRILNTSSVAMGQITRYLGLGSLQNAQQQSNLGVAYLMDGFMDWVTMNMRYAVNQQVRVSAYSKEDNLSFLIGDRGMKYIQLLDKHRLKFEDFFTVLNINDVIDDQRKQRLVTIAQAEAQNGRLSMPEFMMIEGARSMTQIQEEFGYITKKKEREAKQAMAAQTQQEQLIIKTKALEAAELEQLKQDNENYRKQLDVFSKQLANVMDLVQNVPQPPQSPLQGQLAQAGAQQQAAQQQMAQGQMPPQGMGENEMEGEEEIEVEEGEETEEQS
jgi:hypothetical protein